MDIIYGLSKIKRFRRPVVALGVFDGVHLGHRRILKETVKQARALKGTSVVVTFYPHPQKEESLYSLPHRLKLIAQLGIDACIVIRFTPAFSQISAADFIRDILGEKIGARFIFVGKNFRFGKSAKGDFRLLNKFQGLYGYKVKVFNVVKINHQPVSSTSIRALIKRGGLRSAQRLLSRPVTVLGTVVKGISLARKIGFPTANIDPHHEVLPPSGVYAVKVILWCRKVYNTFLTTENRKNLSPKAIFLNHKIFYGVCNIGRKPTLFSRQAQKHIEVYLFSFKRNIYAKVLEIQFIRKIREERKFNSLKLLAAQIKKDVLFTRRLFSLH